MSAHKQLSLLAVSNGCIILRRLSITALEGVVHASQGVES
jgi:hypothetical protein